jgi:hypothetical protein
MAVDFKMLFCLFYDTNHSSSKLVFLLLCTILTFSAIVFISYRGMLLDFFLYFFKHCCICRPSDSAVSEDAGVETQDVGIDSKTL